MRPTIMKPVRATGADRLTRQSPEIGRYVRLGSRRAPWGAGQADNRWRGRGKMRFAGEYGY